MVNDQHVAIFWDYENCAPQSGTSGYAVAKKIREIACTHGSVRSFRAYMELSELSSQRSISFRSELQQSGVSLIDCPHNGRKDVADKMMIVDMMAFAIDTPVPATVVLISGDRDFTYAVSILRHRHYRVVVIVPSTVHVGLTSQASEIIEWEYDVLNKSRPTSQDYSQYLQKVGDGGATQLPASPTNAMFASPRGRRREIPDYSSNTHIKNNSSTSSPLVTDTAMGKTSQTQFNSPQHVRNKESLDTFTRGVPFTSARQAQGLPSDASSTVGGGLHSPWSQRKLLSPFGPSTFVSSPEELLLSLCSTPEPQTANITNLRPELDSNEASHGVPPEPNTPVVTESQGQEQSITIRTLPPSLIMSTPRGTMNLPRVAPLESVYGEPHTPKGLPPRAAYSMPSPKSPGFDVDPIPRPASASSSVSPKDSRPFIPHSATLVQRDPSFVEEPMPMLRSSASLRGHPAYIEHHSLAVQTGTPSQTLTQAHLSDMSQADRYYQSVQGIQGTHPRESQPLGEIPPRFRVLVELLDKLRAEGKERPLRSHVSAALQRQDRSVYAQAGVSKFKHYSEMAQQYGLVELGGVQGGAWVSLRPEYHERGLIKNS